jgi:hypothetical protein
VKWRTILGIAVGLVLPALFIYIHSEVVRWRRWTQAGTLQGARVVPILAQDERRALLTYGHTCQAEKDCDAPLACMSLFPSDESVCVDSSCLTDLQCKQGFTCRTRKALGQGALVRRCVLIGSQQEGRPCFVGAVRPEMACGPGLLCGGDHCGRPCQLDEPSSCPEGFVCRVGLDGPSCQPFCKGEDCPTGQECVSAGSDEARCMVVRGENCQQRLCAEGLECKSTYLPEREAWSVTMECVKPCSEENSCPDDLVCRWGACRQRCGPDNREVCGPRQYCVRYEHDPVWFCEPRLR